MFTEYGSSFVFHLDLWEILANSITLVIFLKDQSEFEIWFLSGWSCSGYIVQTVWSASDWSASCRCQRSTPRNLFGVGFLNLLLFYALFIWFLISFLKNYICIVQLLPIIIFLQLLQVDPIFLFCAIGSYKWTAWFLLPWLFLFRILSSNMVFIESKHAFFLIGKCYWHILASSRNGI